MHGSDHDGPVSRRGMEVDRQPSQALQENAATTHTFDVIFRVPSTEQSKGIPQFSSMRSHYQALPLVKYE